MDIERETVVQVVVSSFAVALFIAALVGLSMTFGVQEPVENRSVEGNLSGEIQQFEQTDGGVSGNLSGEFSNSFQADMDGNVTGTVSGDVVTGEFEGEVTGAVKGSTTGEINGTLENGTFEGTYSGTLNGTDHDTTITPDGGLFIVAAIGLFIIMMPIVGYIIERQSDD